MPELPETETIARELNRSLPGRSIAAIDVIRPDVLRAASAQQLSLHCIDDSVRSVWRRAKTVLISLDRGSHIAIQPRFTGSLLLSTSKERCSDDPYDAVRWYFTDGAVLRYRDVRRLGTVTLLDAHGLVEFSAGLGVEPLDPEFTAPRLSGLLRGSGRAVKQVLMDQRVVGGIGNIYANEALWRALIDPSRPARRVTEPEGELLRDAIVAVLSEAIEMRGTTFRDYRAPDDSRGGFSERLAAYGRGGQPCNRCGSRLVETHAIDGRSTVFCHRCQR